MYIICMPDKYILLLLFISYMGSQEIFKKGWSANFAKFIRNRNFIEKVSVFLKSFAIFKWLSLPKDSLLDYLCMVRFPYSKCIYLQSHVHELSLQLILYVAHNGNPVFYISSFSGKWITLLQLDTFTSSLNHFRMAPHSHVFCGFTFYVAPSCLLPDSTQCLQLTST